MKKIFLILSLLLFPISSINSQTQPPEKEIKISLDSKFYNSASSVIVGFFKQAKIDNFFVDEKLEKQPVMNFKFRDKSIKDTIELLSKIYDIDFVTSEKKDFYFVNLRIKKWNI